MTRTHIRRYCTAVLLIVMFALLSMVSANDENEEETDFSRRLRQLDEFDTPSQAPSNDPTTAIPSVNPSGSPSANPSEAPSHAPKTSKPSNSPSKSPSKSPVTSRPSKHPSSSPSTSRPSVHPSTSVPSKVPSHQPSKSPSTSKPSKHPSRAPATSAPSHIPTTSKPSKSPSTASPSQVPSVNPTPATFEPTKSPSFVPTTAAPSDAPTRSPSTSKPSKSPTTSRPSKTPTTTPSKAPSATPTTSKPSRSPSKQPTTTRPSKSPTTPRPSASPTESPVPFGAQNILFIIVDDLKGALPSFGDPLGQTPNMDRLGSQGIRFTNHQVQVSECAPSRASMFSGRRPDQLLIFSREPYYRVKNRYLMTFPGYFRSLGYSSVALGKTFDPSSFNNQNDYNFQVVDQCTSSEPPGASTCSWDQEIPAGLESADTVRCPLGSMEYPPIPSPFLAYAEYGENLDPNSQDNSRFYDDCTANQAIHRINEYASQTNPFLLVVGFLRPHLPWSSPNPFYADFPLAQETAFANTVWTKDISGNFFVKQSSAASFRRNWDEIASYASTPKKVRWPRAYYVAAHFIDSQIGRVVDAVETSPSKQIRENTLIILWGDNGLHLGPLLYGKKTVFEAACRTPLIIVPSIAWKRAQTRRVTGIGKAISFPVESIDLYPTLVDLANAPYPTFGGLTGKSLMPYFFDQTTQLKQIAISQYRDQRGKFYSTRMGYSIRSNNYRLIMYFRWDPRCWGSARVCTFYQTSPKGAKAELYYYPYPGAFETINVYKSPLHAAARNQMVALMRQKSPAWMP